jgi:hypothetical protein
MKRNKNGYRHHKSLIPDTYLLNISMRDYNAIVAPLSHREYLQFKIDRLYEIRELQNLCRSTRKYQPWLDCRAKYAQKALDHTIELLEDLDR